jgi:Domain of unknown function (DUF3387)
MAGVNRTPQALFQSWFFDFDPVHAKMQGRALEGMGESTAALFPDSFEESELGSVPRGWRCVPFGELLAHSRGEQLGLTDDEVRFYDALASNESAAKDLTDETLKKIAHEMTDKLRKKITVDWSQRESVRADLRLMVKRILRKYKYPPDQSDLAVDLVLQQAEVLGESWEI